ncbi:MAG: TIR domain-containing protein [Caldilinea sp. CFX5]|nr:TIR domain-containing protein [Caldilinea sp. CFX5]
MAEQTKPIYDLFISYAKEDRAWVEGYLLDALKQANVAYYTEAAFDLDKPLLLAFEQAILQSKCTLLVLSPEYLIEGHSLFIDLLAEHYGLETGTWPVIPLILKPVEQIPLRLRMLKPLEAIEKEDREFAIRRLAETIQQPVPPPPPLPDPPYPGMRSYTEEESNIFFGRSREIEDLTNLLRERRFRVLIGPSGSGKSSLVRAGLIPALRKSTAFGRGKWLIRDFRPGENPLAALTNALGGDPTSPSTTIPALLATFPDAQRLLIFVDQFEELFTVARAETRDFQNILVKLAEEPNTYVILGARADFYPKLMTSPIWGAIKQHRYEVLPLDEKGLSEAIVQPAEHVGVYVESALVERIVADAGSEPGILPFVQETMRLLWSKVERRYLPVDAYETLVLPRSTYGERRIEEVTGLQAAIAMHAEAVFIKLEEAQQAIARRIFVRLVQFGEGRSHTRRQQPVSYLRGSIDPTQFDPVLTYLADEKSRLLILGGEEKGPEREVDIAHEALIGAWPRLIEWLDEWRKAEEYRRQLVQDVDQWIGKNKDVSFVYEGVRLQELQKWVANHSDELNAEQCEFLALSKQHDRWRKVRQWFLRGVAALFSLLIVSSIGYGAYREYLKSTAQKMNPLESFSAGFAWLGSDTYPGERGFPKQQVMLGSFSIDTYEVRNEQYCLCYRAGACTPLSEVADKASVCATEADLPVVNVTAYQAAAFCRWIGRRLPTEVEWERAARGADGRRWPWGSTTPTQSHVNMMLEGEPNSEDVLPAAVNDPAFRAGSTPEGIMHLLGNVSEWTSTPLTCFNPYDCPVPWNGIVKVSTLYQRGYSYLSYLATSEMERADPAIATRSAPWSPDDRSPDLGFRCAQ